MKNRHRLIASLALAAAFSLLASIANSQLTTEHPAVAYFVQEKAKAEQRTAENRQREFMAQRALEQAQSALANAERLKGENRKIFAFLRSQGGVGHAG